MAVGLSAPLSLLPVAGCQLASVEAGIRYSGRNDLLLITLAKETQTAAVFTQNAFCAAPVVVAKAHLQETPPLALLINAGNANCGTGARGLADAKLTCEAVATELGCQANQVLPFSTGVIGEYMAVERFAPALVKANAQLSPDAWLAASSAIMTTDTVAKGISKQVQTADGVVTLTGIAKGSGMIRPDMATMLSYLVCDAAVSQTDLQALLRKAVGLSFNSVTVDGDTSTNDACTLSATAASGVELSPSHSDWPAFEAAVSEVCLFLAQAMVRDGEGATKFVEVAVSGADSIQQADAVAYTVAHSPLVKTALFASDANWGRLLMAVGRAPVTSPLQVDQISIHLDDVLIVKAGERAASYSEEQGAAVMSQSEISIKIDLGLGDASRTIWTSDLSHDYVTINAEYRS